MWRNCEVLYLIGFTECYTENNGVILMMIWGWSGIPRGRFVIIGKAGNVNHTGIFYTVPRAKNAYFSGFLSVYGYLIILE